VFEVVEEGVHVSLLLLSLDESAGDLSQSRGVHRLNAQLNWRALQGIIAKEQEF
jgi:hypothetical protein